MVEAYDKWRRWADEKVIRIINNVDVDGDLYYHKNEREG